MFRVALDGGHELIAYTAGKMRRYRIRMAPGDRINVQVSAVRPDPRSHRLPPQVAR